MTTAVKVAKGNDCPHPTGSVLPIYNNTGWWCGACGYTKFTGGKK